MPSNVKTVMAQAFVFMENVNIVVENAVRIISVSMDV